MAVSSTMLALGTPMPTFKLPDVRSGILVDSDSLPVDRPVLIVFLCAHCPYVVHIQPALAQIAEDFAPRGLTLVGITSNDVLQYPQDAPELTAQMADSAGLRFPVLYDESQAVAKAFTAACTPDFFLFSPSRQLAYRGQIDDSRPGRGADRPEKGARDGRHLREAIEAVLSGQPAPAEQFPSIGCNIKWKPGNAPAYFG
jgi:thiol-disulfide isomerase/thioredoxin